METDIESQVIQREQQFIKSVQEILSQEHTDRIKIKLIYENYINCQSKINTMVSESISQK